MSRKELDLDALSRLPEDCTYMDMAERFRFSAAIQEGIDQLDRGESIPHEEVKKDLALWLST